MNYNTREIVYLGGGGLLAVLCLLLPVGIAGKVILGGIVVIGSLVLALYPVKGRLRLDQVLWKRIKKELHPVLFNRHGGARISPKQLRNSTGASELEGVQSLPALPLPAGIQNVSPVSVSKPASPAIPIPARAGVPARVHAITIIPDEGEAEPVGEPRIIYPLVLSSPDSEEIRPASIITYLMIVVSIYVLYWLWTSGMQDFSTFFRNIR